jgi:hypothetical protein
VDERRFEELDRKRFEEGLTQDEANELGRMMAERAGEPYANAGNRPPDEEAMKEEEAVLEADQSKERQEEDAHSYPGEQARELAAQEHRQKDGKDPATIREPS